VLSIASVAERVNGEERTRALDGRTLTHECRDGLLEVLFESGAALLILPIQDVFGWRDRINQPATVGDDNWTWRLPWPSDRLTTQGEAIEVAKQLQEWSARHNR
jgi:4-alpha-glucanotransferase